MYCNNNDMIVYLTFISSNYGITKIQVINKMIFCQITNMCLIQTDRFNSIDDFETYLMTITITYNLYILYILI